VFRYFSYSTNSNPIGLIMSQNKVIIVVVGLGSYKPACRRLSSQIHKNMPGVDCASVEEDDLPHIAISQGVKLTNFKKKSRGFGYWQWKPMVINHFLHMGYQIVVYIDAGCEMNSYSMEQTLNWFCLQNDYDLLLTRASHSISDYTKPGVIDFLGSHRLSQFGAENIEMLQFGILFIKAGSTCASIFLEATNLVKQGNHYLFNDEVRPDDEKQKSYVDHRHDQSVLNLLLLRSKEPERVAVVNGGLSPPNHYDGWKGSPVIAARNSMAISIYGLILRYEVRKAFPILQWLSIKLRHKLTRLIGNPRWLINLLNKSHNQKMAEPENSQNLQLPPDLVQFPLIIKRGN